MSGTKRVGQESSGYSDSAKKTRVENHDDDQGVTYTSSDDDQEDTYTSSDDGGDDDQDVTHTPSDDDDNEDQDDETEFVDLREDEMFKLTLTVKPEDIIIPAEQERESIIRRDILAKYMKISYTDYTLRKQISRNIYFKKSEISAEVKAIIERNKKQRADNLIDWKPHNIDFSPSHVPSLLDLSLKVLANNADGITSLDHVPELLKKKLTDLIWDARTMNIRILELLIKDSSTEICVKDGSWLTEKQLVSVLEKTNVQDLKVLQLDDCRQCSFNEILSYIVARYSLAHLEILSLKGAAVILDNTLWPLLVSTSLLHSPPYLHSLNLSKCTLLTCDIVMMIADCLKTSLKELYLDDCRSIDFTFCFSAITKFERLEVLSVARNITVYDEIVTFITAACGKSLKELNLAGCWSLTDTCLQAIGNFCPKLCSLDVSYVCNLRDLGMCYLADGCKSLESLSLDANCFSDEYVAAFIETSGKSLKQLSLNKVLEVSVNTVFALAKYSKKLESLDLSWCSKLTEEALGFIIDNSSSLKVLKISGCSKLTYNFGLKVTGRHALRDTFYL